MHAIPSCWKKLKVVTHMHMCRRTMPVCTAFCPVAASRHACATRGVQSTGGCDLHTPGRSHRHVSDLSRRRCWQRPRPTAKQPTHWLGTKRSRQPAQQKAAATCGSCWCQQLPGSGRSLLLLPPESLPQSCCCLHSAALPSTPEQGVSGIAI